VIHQGYRIIYRLRADAVEIVMVVHGNRDLSNPGDPGSGDQR
jgi:plasmid stabilization system protein ParE